ncbi:MAG: PIN domain-containing protein [Pirellulales bacterium]
MNAVDTNVYVYALDADEAAKQAKEVEAAFQRARAMFDLRIPSEAMFQISFDLRSRFSLSHWDSMLLAACKDAGVTTLFSEDMNSGTDYDGLTIVNPFA